MGLRPLSPLDQFFVHCLERFGQRVIVAEYHQVVAGPARRRGNEAVEPQEHKTGADLLCSLVVPLPIARQIHAERTKIATCKPYRPCRRNGEPRYLHRARSRYWRQLRQKRGYLGDRAIAFEAGVENGMSGLAVGRWGPSPATDGCCDRIRALACCPEDFTLETLRAKCAQAIQETRIVNHGRKADRA